MRAQRNYMVQTEDQYIFIHEALLEAATCGNTEVPARNLYAHIQKLTQPPSGETVTAMELEFKVTYKCSQGKVFFFFFHSMVDSCRISYLSYSEPFRIFFRESRTLRCISAQGQQNIREKGIIVQVYCLIQVKIL